MPEIQVPGEGPLTAKIVIIGEAPGENEAKMRKPFVGRSGTKLTQMLASAGILRHTCYVTNVVKTRPPNNDISHYIHFDGKGRPSWMSDDFKWYRDYLYEELSRLDQANVFVPVGRVALLALTGFELSSISKYRGSILPIRGTSSPLDGKKIIPTWHPAATDRVYLWTYDSIRDFKRVKFDSEFPELRLPEREIITRPSYTSCMEYLEWLLSQPRVAYDIEIFNNQVTCISFATEPSHAISIAFVDSHGDVFSIEDEARIWLAIQRVLENPSIVKVAQNGAFDSTFLLKKYGIKVRPYDDTMIAHAIAFPFFPKGLDYQCSTLTREPYYKDEGKEAFRGFVRDFTQFWTYNAKDSAVLMEIMPQLLEVLEREQVTSVYERAIRLIPPLTYMQVRGVCFDKNGCVKEAEETRIRQAEIVEEFRSIHNLPEDFNIRSKPQLKKLYYETLKYPPNHKRGAKTSAPSIDDEALRKLLIARAPGVEILREFNKLDKIRSTYLEMKLDGDNRIRGSYNPVGAITGRLSSSQQIEGTGGNMQNLPKQFRRYLVADPGYMCFEMDLGQAENRLVAAFGPEPQMLKAFRNGEDIHARTAALIHGIPIEEVSDVKGTSRFGNGRESQRDWGKRTNHSCNYDMSIQEFARKYDMTYAEAKIPWTLYHQCYPGVRGAYHLKLQAKLREDRILVNPYGRRMRFLGRLDREMFKQAYAWLPSSTVADKINICGLLYIYENQDIFGPVELLNQVHDSIWFQIPISIGWPNIARLLDLIRISMETPVPYEQGDIFIPSDISAGVAFGSLRKTKYSSLDELSDKLERLYKEVTAS